MVKVLVMVIEWKLVVSGAYFLSLRDEIYLKFPFNEI